MTQTKPVDHFIDKSHEHGPFDIIGDLHGCFDELQALLLKLGYQLDIKNDHYQLAHPQGRKVVFVGDLVSRGPRILETLKFLVDTAQSGNLLCVSGNHDDKLRGALLGRKVKITPILQDVLDQLETTSKTFCSDVLTFLENLPPYLILDGGNLVVVHAGIQEKYIGYISKSIRAYCLYGQTNNEIDQYGFPVRYPWPKDYRGKALIAYGHTPVRDPERLNQTINLDTGCVFGGKLTALRYPEDDLCFVKAQKQYALSKKPLDHWLYKETS